MPHFHTRSRSGLLLIACLGLLVSGSGCSHFGRFLSAAAGPAPQFRAQNEEGTKPVYVISNGWHAGLVVRRSDVNPKIWPESLWCIEREFIEIGWGDEGFYCAKHITPWLVLDAALLPSAGVLHIVGFDRPVEECFKNGDIIRIELTEEQHDKLCEYVHRAYELDDQGLLIPLGPGLYGDSQFFRAKEKYYFPNTCNVWTARALDAAGLPVMPALATTADGVLWQARRLGVELSSRGE